MERHEVRPARWKIALAMLGGMAFVALGFAMLAYGRDIVERAAGLLSIVFFGGFGAYAVYTRSRGQGRLAIVDSGVEVSMFGPSPRLIPWRDIEAIGVLTVARQAFTTIRLRRYGSLLEGLTPEEARRALRSFQGMRMLSYATMALANPDEVSDLAHFTSGSDHVKSVLGVLQHTRATYGAELILPWSMRDRGAREFADYLEACRRQYS